MTHGLVQVMGQIERLIELFCKITLVQILHMPKATYVSVQFSSVHFTCSVVSDSLQPHGLQRARPPVRRQLPELTQTHVHRVGDANQPSHPLLPPFPLAFNLSQHQGLFQ